MANDHFTPLTPISDEAFFLATLQDLRASDGEFIWMMDMLDDHPEIPLHGEIALASLINDEDGCARSFDFAFWLTSLRRKALDAML